MRAAAPTAEDRRRHAQVYATPGLPRFEFSEIDDRLLAGRNPLTAVDVATLVEQGVTHVLDLREDHEWSAPQRHGRDAVELLDLAAMRRNVVVRDTAPPSGEALDAATAWIDQALDELARHAEHEGTSEALRRAIELAAHADPSPERVETLGGGWVGEAALAIGVYAALAARDVRHGLLVAVNHSGDSDSTGSIAGNLLGALHGIAALPLPLLLGLEARHVITRVADDLVREATDPPATGDAAWALRYPGE